MSSVDMFGNPHQLKAIACSVRDEMTPISRLAEGRLVKKEVEEKVREGIKSIK